MLQLTISQRKFWTDHPSLDVFQQELKDARTEMDRLLQDPNAKYLDVTEFGDYFRDHLFHQHHPEYQQLLTTPDRVQNSDERQVGFAGAVGEPLTDHRRALELCVQWSSHEMAKTQEYKRYFAWHRQYDRVRRSIGTTNENMTRWTVLRDRLQQPPSQVSTATMQTLSSLLTPFSRQPKKRKQADGGVAAIVFPSTLQTKMTRFLLSQSEDHYGIQGAYELVDAKRRPMGLLLPDGNFYLWDSDRLPEMLSMLHALGEHPQEFFATLGKKWNICLLCGHGLTDQVSRDQGYGPTCAKILRKAVVAVKR